MSPRRLFLYVYEIMYNYLNVSTCTCTSSFFLVIASAFTCFQVIASIRIHVSGAKLRVTATAAWWSAATTDWYASPPQSKYVKAFRADSWSKARYDSGGSNSSDCFWNLLSKTNGFSKLFGDPGIVEGMNASNMLRLAPPLLYLPTKAMVTGAAASAFQTKHSKSQSSWCLQSGAEAWSTCLAKASQSFNVRRFLVRP